MSKKVFTFIEKQKNKLQIIEAMDIIFFNSHFISKDEREDSEGEYEEETEYEKILNRYRITSSKSNEIFKQLQPVLIKEYFGITDFKLVKCIQKEMFGKERKSKVNESKKVIFFENLDSQPNIVVENILMNLDMNLLF